MEEMFQPVIAGYFIFCLQNRLWGSFTLDSICYANTAVPFTTPLFAIGFDVDTERSEAKPNKAYCVWIRTGSSGNRLKFASGSDYTGNGNEVLNYLCFAI